MKTKTAITLALVGLLVSSCTSPYAFDGVSASSTPPLLMTSDATRLMRLNSQAPSFWRLSERYHIPTGRVTCHFAYSDRHITTGYADTTFAAKAGRSYSARRLSGPVSSVPAIREHTQRPVFATLHPSTSHAWIVHDPSDCIIVEDVTRPETPLVVAIASRVDYIFGVDTAEAAVTRYIHPVP